MAKKQIKVEAGAATKEMNERFERLYTDFIVGRSTDEILEELNDIENEKFSEYATWIPLRGLIMLKSYLCLDEEDDDIKLACRKRVASMTNSCSDDLIEAFQMMLEGEITGLDLLELAKESGDSEWERSMYIKILSQFITIVEMGASRKFGYAEAVKTLDKCLSEARRRW